MLNRQQIARVARMFGRICGPTVKTPSLPSLVGARAGREKRGGEVVRWREGGREGGDEEEMEGKNKTNKQTDEQPHQTPKIKKQKKVYVLWHTQQYLQPIFDSILARLK